MKRTSYSVALIATTVAILNGLGLLSIIFAEANSKQYLDNQEIYDTAKSLESAGLLQDNVSSEMIQNRILLLYSFARPPKSSYAKNQIDQFLKSTNDFKFKAYEYAKDNMKGKKNWFSNIKNVLGPIIPMKNIAKKYPFLQDLTQHYENESNKGLLNNDDVDCDMSKFKISQLYNVYFVLQTDIKYLLVGEQELINRAIYEQLKEDKKSSPHNFYEVGAQPLNNKQRDLLKKYFSDHMNLLITNVGNSVDHFYNPGEFIFGRLLDTCQAVNQYENMWAELEAERQTTCSKSAINYNAKLISEYYNISAYEDIFMLCQGLFDAM